MSMLLASNRIGEAFSNLFSQLHQLPVNITALQVFAFNQLSKASTISSASPLQSTTSQKFLWCVHRNPNFGTLVAHR
jgi:hypothetical protein